ncbi:MAG TPA: Crp/Fnr family transcriptional regulator [Chloroflexota bacterium]|nr:Crp/Fnr family transcriptional regulator [Chloroflexota bacterium]
MPEEIAAASLAALPLFAGLTPAQIATIAGRFRRRAIPAGTTLILAEEPGETAYLIEQGVMKVSLLQADGSEVILGLRGQGEMVGEMSLLDHQARSATVTALEPCSVLWVDRATFGAWLHTVPELNTNLLRLLARRLRLAGIQILTLSTLDLYGRVARQLLSLAEQCGEPLTDDGASVLIPLRLTQSDLAAMVGATRARVNAVLMYYKRHGMIEVDRSLRITLRDPAALEARAR